MSTTPAVPVPVEYAALIDDAAALSPPSSSSWVPDTLLAAALAGYRASAGSPYSAALGALVVPDEALPELRSLAARPGDGPEPPLCLRVVVSGGAGGVEPVVGWCTVPGWELSGVEVALRDLDDLAGNVRRVTAAAQAAGLDGPSVLVRPPALAGPPTYGWLAALDEVAAGDHGLLVDADRADAAALSAFLDAALDREVPFTVNGVRRAVRGQGHGFLNLLLATRACLDGDDVVGVLEDSDATSVVDRVRSTGSASLGRTRRWFRSCAAPTTATPLADLLGLGLLADRAAEPG